MALDFNSWTRKTCPLSLLVTFRSCYSNLFPILSIIPTCSRVLILIYLIFVVCIIPFLRYEIDYRTHVFGHNLRLFKSLRTTSICYAQTCLPEISFKYNLYYSPRTIVNDQEDPVVISHSTLIWVRDKLTPSHHRSRHSRSTMTSLPINFVIGSATSGHSVRDAIASCA